MLVRQLIKTITIYLSLIILGLATMSITNAQQSKDIDYPYSEEDFSPCGVKKTEQEMNTLIAPQEKEIGAVSYVTGGTCSDEVKFMKSIASQFPLEIVMVESEGNREIYIADVHITLTNSEQKQVLDVVTEGPFLLVKLPDGDYQVTASFRGIEQTKKVAIHQAKHRRIVFVWQAEEEQAVAE